MSIGEMHPNSRDDIGQSQLKIWATGWVAQDTFANTLLRGSFFRSYFAALFCESGSSSSAAFAGPIRTFREASIHSSHIRAAFPASFCSRVRILKEKTLFARDITSSFARIFPVRFGIDVCKSRELLHHLFIPQRTPPKTILGY